MDSKTVRIGLLLILLGVANAKAEDNDLTEGQTLFNKECSVCHGVMSNTKTGDLAPVRSKRRPVHVAMAPSAGLSVADFQIPLSADWRDASAVNDLHQHHAAGRDRIAVVPLYGPPLKGVIGRVAGTFSGYTYSKAFLQIMEGVAWDESKMDAWIISSQTMVPGSFMFYSQKKPDVRSKIIQYLKAQSQ
jgi:cytochrome c2